MGDRAVFLAETETNVAIVRGPDEGPSVGVLEGRSLFRVTSAETGGAYAMLVQDIPAGQGPPPHVHRHETEIFHILEGRFELTVGERRVVVGPGATATCPRDIPHTFRNVGETGGRLLLTVIPGRFSEYFVEMGAEAVHDLATMKRVGEKYGLEILE